MERLRLAPSACTIAVLTPGDAAPPAKLVLLPAFAAPEVVLAAIEERQRVADAVEGRKLELVEARVAKGAFLALLEKLWALCLQGHLFLGELNAAEMIFYCGQNIELLDKSCHELPVFLLCLLQGLG